MRHHTATRPALLAAGLAVTLGACTPPAVDPAASTTSRPTARRTVWATVTVTPTPRRTVWATVTATAVQPSRTPAPPATTSTPARPPAPAPAGTALATLGGLPVKPLAPLTGYAREQFGQPYADTNRDGCDSRNQALQRDLTGVGIKPGSHGCAVQSGTLTDPYTGQTITYARGQHSPIDYEHVVALEDAWATGAQQLTPDQREQLANDPLNVLMTAASANRAKGGADASGWLPPNHDYRCSYVSRQIAVKARYGLWVTDSERAAMTRVLTRCPGQRLPDDDQVAFPALH